MTNIIIEAHQYHFDKLNDHSQGAVAEFAVIELAEISNPIWVQDSLNVMILHYGIRMKLSAKHCIATNMVKLVAVSATPI